MHKLYNKALQVRAKYERQPIKQTSPSAHLRLCSDLRGSLGSRWRPFTSSASTLLPGDDGSLTERALSTANTS